MGTEQSPAAAGGKLQEMQIGAPSSTAPRPLRALGWGEELSAGWMCIVWMCLLSAGLLVSGLRNPLLELLWEAESGPAIGAPVQSLGQNAATRSQRQPGGGPPGAAATQPCVDFSGTYVSPEQPQARPFSGCFSSSSASGSGSMSGSVWVGFFPLLRPGRQPDTTAPSCVPCAG